MKNVMKTVCMLALILFWMTACNKHDENHPKPKDEKYAVAFQLQVNAKTSEKAILIDSKSQLKSIFESDKNEKVFLMKLSDRNNIFAMRPPISDGTTGPVDPVDPITACWKEIHAYYDSHYEQWQNQANQNCQEVMVCLTCPKAGVGLYVLYVIKPNKIKCLQAAIGDLHYALFNVSGDDYNNDEVSAFIEKM